MLSMSSISVLDLPVPPTSTLAAALFWSLNTKRPKSISPRFTTIFCEDSALVLTWLLPGTILYYTTIASAPLWVACVRVLCPILPVTIFFRLCALPHLSFLLSYFLFFLSFFCRFLELFRLLLEGCRYSYLIFSCVCVCVLHINRSGLNYAQ